MSYREMQRRLEQLEATREQQERAAQRAWAESLSFEELERLVADYAARDPVGKAAADAMSMPDLDRLVEGKMPDAEWEQHLERAQERLGI